MTEWSAQPLSAALLSAIAMTAIVGLRYLATSGFFAWLTARVRPGRYSGMGRQIRSEISWSLASAAIFGIPAGIVAWGWQEHGWTRVYTRIDAYPLWYLPLSVLAYLFLHDTWFYWTHRWMHRPVPFKVAHAVHHASRPPTAWAAMSFHPWEAITDHAKAQNCDLIVMASHGRRGVSALLLGSETQKVLTHSAVPILIVK